MSWPATRKGNSITSNSAVESPSVDDRSVVSCARALQDEAFRKQFGLLDWEEELVRHDSGFRAPSPTSRVDTFFVHGRAGLRLTEYNAETPASPAYNDVLADVFYGLPVMREFLHHYEVRYSPARHSVLNTLIDAYQQWIGRRELPH